MFIRLIFMALAVLSVAGAAASEAKPGLKVGVLRCFKVEGSGVNLIIHSVAQVRCRFITENGVERYKGETGIGLGIDLEWDKAKSIAFTVFGAVSDSAVAAHALAGDYVGAKASASVGYGVGARVLVGKGEKHFTLQPLAIEESIGFGVAAGLGYLHLEPDTEYKAQ